MYDIKRFHLNFYDRIFDDYFENYIEIMPFRFVLWRKNQTFRVDHLEEISQNKYDTSMK